MDQQELPTIGEALDQLRTDFKRRIGFSISEMFNHQQQTDIAIRASTGEESIPEFISWFIKKYGLVDIDQQKEKF